MSSRSPRVVVALLTALGTLALVASASSAAGAGASTDRAVSIAIAHLEAQPGSVGATSAGVRELAVSSAYTSKHNGLTHVNLNQRHEGLDVFGAHATVNVDASGKVVFVGGGFERGLAVASSGAELDATAAVAAAADGLGLDEPERLRVLSLSVGSAQEAVLSGGGISDEPIQARLGWQPTKDGLRLAWQLTIDDASDAHLWNATVDASSGDLLAKDDWTEHDPPEELADRLGRGGGQTSSAVATLAAGPTVFETANPVDDGSSYRIYPQESPDDSDRVLETSPADGIASPFGWHDTDGADGHEFTITRGNNVHAYTDRDNDGNQDPGGSPDGGESLTFDFPIDLGEHPQYNVPANITNLFRWCNVVHDLMYLYGFDEVSGNFQVNNYGRGGVGGDDVRCEGMDGSGENNANFSTPAQDGGRPRMQTFIETGTGLPSAVTVESGPAAGTHLASYARFTPPATTAGTSGTLVLVNDGVGSPTDGCTPYSLPAGAIAVVDQVTTCNNYTQTVNAENAGAVAVVVLHTATNTPTMSGSMTPPVGIPAIRVGSVAGNTIRAALAESPAPGRVHRNTARPPMRIGDLDTATIIHEYSHGVSNRLTGGPNTNCLSGQEQMGEGWGDWHAIVALIDTAKDDPQGPRGIFPYVVFQEPRTGPGLRNRPYSRNMEIQPATYDSIKTNGWLLNAAGNPTSLSQPHGIGHAWAAFLWDMTWDLIEKRGFNPNLYEPWNTGGNNLAYQLVNDGLKIQGCGPTFVTGRDAILTAEEVLQDGEDACTLWASFSRRGLGFSASDGGTNGRNDGTEAFDTHPACLRGFQTPANHAYGTLRTFTAGDTIPLRFSYAAGQGLDVLASNSPFSRRVDCDTLRVPSIGAGVTPREYPVNTTRAGQLSRNSAGVYHYNWVTEADWAGTCRELVLTREDGVQHRSFFRFAEAG
ncbi:MAG TPA: M36 family metallopeptidase [Actinomycetota bacterium]|nr:M36 family metallopeptidase [Actinomycetota bacterium]